MTSRVTFLRDARDWLPVSLAAVHAGLLVWLPEWWLLALLLWWNANTISHQFIHRRFFTHGRVDDAFSLALSLLLGFPQRLWRQRHLAHHRERRWRLRRDRRLAVETIAVLAAWAMLAVAAPTLFWSVWLPGTVAGHGLCWLQGYGEHRGGTTSIHARWWNLLFLNDGYHVEHHRAPGVHFRDLPRQRRPDVRTSRLPPVLRWLDQPWLDHLERLVLCWPWLRGLVLRSHRRALRVLLAELPPPRSVVVVGGGLFPRTALLLRELLPDAAITVVDAAPAHLQRAVPWLPAGVETKVGTFVPGQQFDCDLVVLPLALLGDRRRCYERPAAPAVLVHDWLWQVRGRGQVVAWWLGKRINLVRAEAQMACVAG